MGAGLTDSGSPLGGFGLRGAVRHGPAAHLASLSLSQPLIKIMRGRAASELKEEPLESPVLESSQADALVEVEPWADLPYALSLAHLNSQLRVPLQLEQALEIMQQELSGMLDHEVRAALLESSTSQRE